LCSVGAGEWSDWNISVASGIAFSGRSEEVLWKLNNVRSTRNKISAILGHNKRRLADVKLFGTGSWDWEAIAANRENGTSYIYLADIGDKSFKLGSSQTIYKFKEPRVSHNWYGHIITIWSPDIERIRVKYPDHVHDCKAMTVDPLNGDILLFTKNHQHQGSKVYKVPRGSNDTLYPRVRVTLEYVTTLPSMLVTGADISPTGDILALTNNGEGWSWRKPDSLMSWADFLRTGPTPCGLNLNQEEQPEVPSEEITTKQPRRTTTTKKPRRTTTTKKPRTTRPSRRGSNGGSRGSSRHRG